MQTLLIILLSIIVVGAIFAVNLYFHKNLNYWLPFYILHKMKKSNNKPVKGSIDIFICIADHYEPGYAEAPIEKQRQRVARWVKEFPELCRKHKDYDGKPPRHTWFFPPHYDTDTHLEKIAELCKQGLGEVEIHFHHNRVEPFPDTEETFKKKIVDTIKAYSRFGLIPYKNGEPCFSFVHGDWALDNSRGDEFCGINNEIKILSELGCYADLTFPCQYESQPGKINTFFYAENKTDIPKSHDTGIDVEAEKKGTGDLMIMQGVLGLRKTDRVRSLFIAIEDSDISNINPPTKERIDYWVKNGIKIKGKDDAIFIKLHTHGAWEGCMNALLGNPAEEMHAYLTTKYNDGTRYRLHYVTAREMYNVIKAIEEGEDEELSLYRDYVIPAPPVSLSGLTGQSII